MGMRDCCTTAHGNVHTNDCANAWKMLPTQPVIEEPSSAGFFTSDDALEYTRRGTGVYHHDLCVALCISEEMADEMTRGLQLIRYAGMQVALAGKT